MTPDKKRTRLRERAEQILTDEVFAPKWSAAWSRGREMAQAFLDADDERARMDEGSDPLAYLPMIADNSAMVRLSDVSATTFHEDECRDDGCPGCYRPRDGEAQEEGEPDG